MDNRQSQSYRPVVTHGGNTGTVPRHRSCEGNLNAITGAYQFSWFVSIIPHQVNADHLPHQRRFRARFSLGGGRQRVILAVNERSDDPRPQGVVTEPYPAVTVADAGSREADTAKLLQRNLAPDAPSGHP